MARDDVADSQHSIRISNLNDAKMTILIIYATETLDEQRINVPERDAHSPCALHTIASR